MQSEKASQRALLIMLLGTLLLVLAVFRPFGVALFLAAVLSMVLWPVQRWLSTRLKGRGGLAAGLTVAAVTLLVLGPLIGMSAFIVKETAQAVRFVTSTIRSSGVSGLIEKLPDNIEALVSRGVEQLELDTNMLTDNVGKVGGTAAITLSSALTATGALVFQGVMMLIALFFFLSQKDRIVLWLDHASPLRSGQTRELFSEFRNVCRSVIISTLATSAVQAVAAFVGYLIARVPHPFFFFGLTFISAFIPAVGAAGVCLLAAGLLFVLGHPWAALFLALYGVLIVGLVDNIIKPLLMKNEIQMPGTVVFFALLGGLAAFGGMGLLLGPLAVALFVAMLRIYQRDYAADPADRAAMRASMAKPRSVSVD